MMKQLKVFSLSLITIMFFHCSNDGLDNGNRLNNQWNHENDIQPGDSEGRPTLPEILIGDWNITDIVVTGNIKGVENSENLEYWGWVFAKYPIPVLSQIELQSSTLKFESPSNNFIANTDFIINYSGESIIFSKSINSSEVLRSGRWSFDDDSSSIIIDRVQMPDKFSVLGYSQSEVYLSKQFQEKIEVEIYPDEFISMWTNLTIKFTLSKQ